MPVGFLRVIVLTARQFRRDNCQLRASALTFYTLMSVVPVLAMAFGIAKGFDLDERLRGLLLNKLPSQKEALSQIIDFAGEMLESARGGAIAGVGVVFLIWAILRMIGQIESAFNDIWGIKKGRAMGRKFSDYLSLMLVFPITLVLAGSLNVFLAQLTAENWVSGLPWLVQKTPFVLLPLISFAMMAGLLSFLYAYIPNTTVKSASALIGGVSAAAFYEIVQWMHIHAQMLFSGFGAVYGSFAALPLFLIWLQLSWIVILLGAEIAFAHQNADTYEFEPDAMRASFALRKILAKKTAFFCAERFKAHRLPTTAETISDELDIPIRLCRSILEQLVDAGLLAETRRFRNRHFGYQPAIPVKDITSERVVESLERLGINELPNEGSKPSSHKVPQKKRSILSGLFKRA